jgi:hypothetical protein
MTFPARQQPPARQVSVYVYMPPNMQGLVNWQKVVLVIGAFFIILTMGRKLFPLTFVIFSFMVALLRFPTGQRPLGYLQYLRRRLPSRPAENQIVVLENGVVLADVAGARKAMLACSGVITMAQLSHFLSALTLPVELVVTTGADRVHHLLMVDAEEDAENAGEVLLNAAYNAGFELEQVDASLFEIKAANKIGSAQYMVERLPPILSYGAVSSILTTTTCAYTATMRIARADVDDARRQAAKLFAPLNLTMISMQMANAPITPEMASVRRGAEDLLNGITQPYDISLDFSLAAKEGVELNLATMRFQTAMNLTGITLKHVRTRRLPFLANFREPPVPYHHIVSAGAVEACCPFVFRD